MDCVADAVSLVRKLNAEAWVGFNDGNLQYMSEVKRLAPELPVFWDRGPTPDLDQDIPTAIEHGFESLILHHQGVTKEGVERISAAGLEVGAWTVNDPATMKRLLGIGVQRLYTDHPRALIAMLADHQFHAVECEGTYPHHLQGVCIGEDAIYWSFTTQLVKSDLAGKPLQQIPVANHHGDLCFHDGKLFVAVNLGQFNRPAGSADSWVYVYDAETLDELARHETPQVVHGAGGVGYQQGRFLVVGGLPEGIEENYLYEYDESFRFVKRHTLSSGYTRLGIQTATFHQDRWWFGCYGSPQVLLVADADLRLLGRHEFDCSLGIEGLPDGRFFVAGGRCRAETGCKGWVQVAVQKPNTGLQIVASQ
jgi:hypothetical protein